ncbi:MAG TPA: hypothetical protein VGJ26_06340, partial [Pirellulales bacterium]
MDQDAFRPTAGQTDPSGSWPDSPRTRLLARHPWLLFVLPFAVYMLVGSLEPAAPKAVAEALRVAGVEAGSLQQESPSPQQVPATESSSPLGIRYQQYPIIYAAKIVLTIAAMWFVAPGYGRRVRISPLAPLVGVVGVALWIWICSLHLEPKLLDPLGLGWIIGSGERPAYNPLEQLAATPILAYGFLAIRFLGLAV